MKKKVLGLTLCSAVAAVSLAVGGMCLQNASATELPKITLEGTGDEFLLTEQTYTAEESFVFTSTAYFESGQAAALVFGGDDTEGERNYWAFNIDRTNNVVKLLYFYETETQSFTAVELLTDYYIGNDKMTDGEKSLVNPKVAAIDKVQLKVVVSVEDDGKIFGEFYADNIRRFGIDTEIELNALERLPDGESYEGGAIGYNCFNAKIRFEDTHYGASDYSYYTEAYRQQYHYSQYAHWNNDPNGLVYYDGWYHMYYQHHPYNNYWGDMYWGHARSKDLVHWELLPICLFPDTEGEFGGGNGYMWSGSAMVYRQGMSDAIDALNWYPNGNGTGLIAFYTRDGALQDQVIMSSDDGGMTWTKRKRIPQTIVVGPNKTDCRDPKVFPVKKEGDTVTLWGMVVTGMATGDVWFMKSTNLLDWSAAGGFKCYNYDQAYNNVLNFRAECPDVVTLTADDGTTHNVLSLTGRSYLVGEITYDENSGNIVMQDLEGNDLAGLGAENLPYQRMDFGADSYATQTFFIDDATSAYNGKTVSVSWFSAIPNAKDSVESGSLAALRKTWNGGGVTIPVVWGLKKTDNGYVLTQTPIVKDNTAFDKTEEAALTQSTVIDENSENLLKDVQARTLEIEAEIANPNGASVAFKVQMDGDEYTEIGWNPTDGYYVDRTHTYDGGMTIPNYRTKYKTGACDGENLKFYILVDNGSVEAFCGDFAYPFYVLTFASPYSMDASLEVDGEVTVNTLKVNEIASVWRDDATLEEGVVYISHDELELSTTLTKEKEVTVYATNGAQATWEVTEGSSVVSVTPTDKGAIVKALSAGTAKITMTCGTTQKTVTVKVHQGVMDTDLQFAQSGIVSGDWLMTTSGLVGIQSAGDAFLLSSTTGSDFTYTAKFDVGNGAAAALVFRAKADMSDYYIANYDKNGKIVKLWTPFGELGNVWVGDIDTANVVLSVIAKGNVIRVQLNGNTVIDVTDTREGSPTEGLFGLNVCATRATFKEVGIQQDNYTYSSGKLVVKGAVKQAIVSLYNDTDGGVEISRNFYTVSGREIRIAKEYFSTLSKTGVYKMRAVGVDSSFEFNVTVNTIPALAWEDLTVQEGNNVTFYVGREEVTEVTVDGEVLSTDKYQIKDGVLTIDASAFKVGDNEVTASATLSAIVTVEALATTIPESDEGCNSSVSALGLAAVAACGAGLMLRRKKDGNDD
ncbi:MAG: GH32 C-terminal domain-containing protein [Clostridia bacterium]|nr:GH32 C-terminal domain-containing protein [Clostridia bacterium]